jgi:hypothetical protein
MVANEFVLGQEAAGRRSYRPKREASRMLRNEGDGWRRKGRHRCMLSL